MAGYVIHLAVAELYIKKHPEDIKSYKEFIKGVIAPDDVLDKSITHYGPKSSKVNLKAYLKENDIRSSYAKGYFLHLVTDYIFYNKFIEYFSNDIYNDYDILNKKIIEKFNVKIPDNIKNKVFYKEGKTIILKIDKTVEFIENITNYRLEDIKKQVLDNDKYWLTFRDLHKK